MTDHKKTDVGILDVGKSVHNTAELVNRDNFLIMKL